MKKDDELTVDIIDMGINGEGVAKPEGMPIFVKGAIKGENVKIKVIKQTKDYAIGKILEIIEQSPDRQEPICPVFNRCGGCEIQHIRYNKQLEYKINMVRNNFRKFGLDENKIVDIIGMDNPYNYRDKAQYPFAIDKEGNVITGFYSERSHTVIKNDGCKIEHIESEKIVKYICEFANKNKVSVYDEKTGKGYLRHVIIRIGFATNQVMVIFVTNGKDNKLEKLNNQLVKEFESIKTIVQNINEENTNVIMGEKNKVLYGEGYILDNIGKYKFKISPQSFYQVNPIQTQNLYAKAKEYLGKTDILFDLYCGIGTIGIFCSDVVNKIYGIEIVKDAIDDAKENAKLNKLDNMEFLVGASEDKINELYEKEITADAIILDPPRKGLEKKLIEVILDKKPAKIIYISCNNATLSRDLKLLSDEYELKECTLVDMFPQTSHVEAVTLLLRKNVK